MGSVKHPKSRSVMPKIRLKVPLNFATNKQLHLNIRWVKQQFFKRASVAADCDEFKEHFRDF